MELITWPIMTAFNKKSDTKVKGGYHFYDMNAKVDYSFTDRSRAYLSFYMGSDSYRNGEEAKDMHGQDWDFCWRWGNLIGSAGWNYLINKKLFATFTGGYTRISLSYYPETEYVCLIPGFGRTALLPGGALPFGDGRCKPAGLF